MIVKRFAQSDQAPETQGRYWYENEKGERTECEESLISAMWWVWVRNESGSYRDDKDGWTVFAFEEPQAFVVPK